MNVTINHLPLELAPGPFRSEFYGSRGDAKLSFWPGWAIIDRDGVLVATVARSIDAEYMIGLLNRAKKDPTGW